MPSPTMHLSDSDIFDEERWAVKPLDDVRSTACYRAFALEQVVRRLTLKLA